MDIYISRGATPEEQGSVATGETKKQKERNQQRIHSGHQIALPRETEVCPESENSGGWRDRRSLPIIEVSWGRLADQESRSQKTVMENILEGIDPLPFSRHRYASFQTNYMVICNYRCNRQVPGEIWSQLGPNSTKIG